MRVIAVLNQKGGVGKTTSSVNLAHGLALQGPPVLALDLDPQDHLTASLGMSGAETGMDSVLLDGASMSEVMRPARENLWLISAGSRLTDFEGSTSGGSSRGWLLERALAQLEDEGEGQTPDWVVIDCPPSSGLLAMNALLASDDLLIPVASDFLSLQGLSTLMQTLQRLEQRLKADSRKWLFLTRYQTRRRLCKEVQETLAGHFPGHLLPTPIRENVALAEAPSFGQSVFEYQAQSNGATDYLALLEDLLLERVM